MRADHRTFHSNMSAIKTLNPKAEVARAAQVRWLTWECEPRQTCTKRIRFVSIAAGHACATIATRCRGRVQGWWESHHYPHLGPRPLCCLAVSPLRARTDNLHPVVGDCAAVCHGWCRLQRTERVRSAKGVPPSLRAFQRLTHALHTCHSPVRVCAHMLVCGHAIARGRASLGPWPHR